MTLKDAMNYLHSVYDIGNSGEELLDTANVIIKDFYAHDVKLKKGVLEFLEYCLSNGIKMCIASATDIYLKALDSLSTSISETCIFEDSHIAIDTAHKIGMKTVGIYDKYNYGQEEIKKIATVYISDGENLKKLIDEDCI